MAKIGRFWRMQNIRYFRSSQTTVTKLGPISHFIHFYKTALHACKYGTPHIAHNIVAYLFECRDALFIKPCIVANGFKMITNHHIVEMNINRRVRSLSVYSHYLSRDNI